MKPLARGRGTFTTFAMLGESTVACIVVAVVEGMFCFIHGSLGGQANLCMRASVAKGFTITLSASGVHTASDSCNS